jgi:hypothetical protein
MVLPGVSGLPDPGHRPQRIAAGGGSGILETDIIVDTADLPAGAKSTEIFEIFPLIGSKTHAT